MNDNYPCPETDGESIVVDDKNISTTTATTAMIQVQLHPIYSTTTTTTTQQEQQEENVDFIQVSITEKSTQEATTTITTTTTLANMEEKEPAEQQHEQQEMEENFISLSIQGNNNNNDDIDDNDKRIRIELKSRFESSSENDEQQSSSSSSVPSSQEEEEEEAQPGLLMDSSTEKQNSQTMNFSSTENDHEHFSFTTDSQQPIQEQEMTLDQNDTDDIKKSDDQNENTIVTLPSEEANSSSFRDEAEISFESDQTMPNDETSNGGEEKEQVVETAKDEEELAVEEKEEATLNFGEDKSHDNGIEKHDNNDVNNVSNTDADTNIYVEKSGSDNVDESQQFAFEKDDNDAWGDEKVVFNDHQTNAADDNIALENNVDENKNDDHDNNGITVQDQNNNVQSEVEIKENHVHPQEHLIENQAQESEGFDANFDADFADDQFDQSNHVSNDNNVPIETASPTDQKREEEKEQEQVETPTLDHEQTTESEGFAADFDADFGADEFISETPNEQPVNNDEPIKEEITSNVTTKEEEFDNADFTTDFDSFPEEVTTTDEAPPQTNDSTPTEEPVALTKEEEIEESTQKDIAEEHNDDGFDDADFGDFPEDDVLQTTDAMGDEDFGDFPDFEDISAPDNGSSTLNDEELDEFNDFGNVQDESKDDFGDFDEPETSVEETEPQVTEEEAKEAEREHLLLKQLEQSISSSILSSEHESMSMDNLQQLFTTILMPTTMQYIINGKGLSMERANNRNLSLEKLFKVNSSQNANILSKMAVWSDSCTETQFLKSMGLQRKNNTVNSISKYQRRVATKTATTPRHTRGASSSDGFQDFNRLPSTYTRRPSSSSDQSMSPVVSSANVTDNIFNESSNKVQNESTQAPQQPKPTNSFEDDFDNFGDFPEPTPNAEPTTPIASQQQISDDLIAFIDAFSSPRNNSMKTKVVPSKELADISSLVFTSPAPKTSTARSIQFNQTPTSPVQTTEAPEFEADFGEEFDTDFSNGTKLPDNKTEAEITPSPNQEKLQQEVQSFGDADFDADFGDFPADEVTQTQTIATNVTEPVDASFDAAFDESDFGEMTGPDHSETEKEQTNATSVSSPTNSIPVEVQQKVDEMLMDLPDLSSILPVATISQPTSTTGQNFDFLFE